jgi:ferredoxin--NADP+ reductase
MQDGSLYQHLDIAGLDPEQDRVMICGSMAMLKDVRTLVEKAGFVEGANNKPGSFVVERAFVG